MLSNYHTLRYLISTVASVIKGTRIGGLFSQDKGEAVLTSPDTDEALLFSCRNDTNTFFLHPRFSRARVNSVNILAQSVGKTIVSAGIVGSDRTIRLQLNSGDSIYAQFYGARANILLVREDGVIADAFKNSRKYIGATFEEPDHRPLEIDPGALEAHLRPLGGDSWQAFKKFCPTLGSILISEIHHRAGIERSAPVGQLEPHSFHNLGESLRGVLADLDHPQPRIYFSADSTAPELFSLIHLHQLGNRTFRSFDDVNEAIRTFIYTRRGLERSRDERKVIVTAIEKSVERASRTVAAMKGDLENSTRAEEYQMTGTLLLSHLREIPEGSSSWTHRDDSGVREIILDPRRTAAQNAQRYFDRAKQSRAMRAQARQRLSGLEGTITAGKSLLAALDQTTSREELQTLMKERSDELHLFGISEKGKREELPPFRIFTVDGGFQVLAGKSSANNDTLTMKYAKQNDLWFHARGSSGSHVVLRVGSAAGTPSKKAKEQAAGIAAYYSKMRNAKNVPVAMTERKYVHKPKGASPGTVVLDRESVIYANPALPGDA